MKRWARAMALLLALAVATSGCATMGPQITTVNYYPKCYEPLAQLRKSNEEMVTNVAGGAVVGAVGGALVGLLAGGGKADRIIAGAAAGALAGGLGGYALTKQKQIRDDRVRYASYCADIDKDMKTLDGAVVGARISQKCYDEQFLVLMEDIKAKRVSKTEAEVRMKEIQDGSLEAAQILGDLSNKAQDKNKQYDAALEAESKRVGVTLDELQVAAAETCPPPQQMATADAQPNAQAQAQPQAQPQVQPKTVAKKVEDVNPKLKGKDDLVRMKANNQQITDKKEQMESLKQETERTMQQREASYKLAMVGLDS